MHLSRISLTALTLAAICSCSSPVELPKGSSQGYRSARFVETRNAERNPSPGAPENDPQVNAAVRLAITKEFETHGIPVGGSSADLIIAYMLVRQNSVATTMNSDYFGNGRNPMAILEEAHTRGVIKNNQPDDFLNGAIIIDVLDARTNKLVFRNFAVRPIIAGSDPAARERRIHSAVAQALQPFFRK